MGDGEIFPVSGKLTPVARLGKGTYKAVDVDGIVTVTATGIAMSGLSARAELIHVPSFAPPIQYKLMVWETLPQLANYIIGSATAYFGPGPDEKAGMVKIEDADGLHDVPIEKAVHAMSIAATGSRAGTEVEGSGGSLEQAVHDAMSKAPPIAGADILTTLTVAEWGFTSGGFVGLSRYWVKGRIV